MSIAITEDHRALADTAADLLRKRDTRGAARTLLEAPEEPMPAVWEDIVELGWLGLHVPEALGGSGFGLEELVVVVEETGRGLVPGPFVPTVIASAALVATADEATQARFVPGLVDGSRPAAVGFGGDLEVRDGTVSGAAGTVLGAGLATLLVARVGDDLVLVDLEGDGVTVETPSQLDPTRRSGRVTLTGAPATVVTGGGDAFTDLARLVLAAEAVGIAREATEQAAEYAKVRIQFGRPIAMYQAIKHHCANMLVDTELATAAVWDAARAASSDADQRAFTAAIAASRAGRAAAKCASLNIQVHGGIGFTWEHDAHIYLRRATVIEGLIDPDGAAIDLTALTRAGVERAKTIDLPPEAEAMRDEIRAFAESVKDLDRDDQKARLIETGFVMPHWPRPWGREAGAVEQLVIEQEFAAAGVKRPGYGITGWVILTLIQYATEDQVKRWVPAALAQDVIWCQLFSEPDAGSDAAGIKTKATRVDGGWLINGQKVWTSGAHIAGMGFATVRTDPDVPKHEGITTMVIDMHAEGVEVRPLRMTSGASEFNEVFFNDVFVPDDDVVGPINAGWTVARATLGNESVSIGGGDGGMALPGSAMIPVLDQRGAHLPGGEARVGHYIAMHQAMGLLNLRSANRAVAGGGPGPEGNVTKLVMSELGHEAASVLSALSAEQNAFMDGSGAMSGGLVLMNRALSIAGGTSEIKRNQIGERILGLPRDPLIK
ncbi:MAG: acyl-CoA dehydrogenase [Actinomycetota bacterium]